MFNLNRVLKQAGFLVLSAAPLSVVRQFNMKDQMQSGTLIVTGGSRGIGAATALLCASRGWDVIVNYHRDHDAAGSVVKAIRDAGGSADSFQADVANEKTVVELFGFARARGKPLRGLVNNAGTLETQMRLEDMDAGRLDRVFATNVKGAFLCAREAVRAMSTRHGGSGGSIVNVSSAASRLGSANEYIDYASSKGAMDTMTIGLANEVAEESIRVNAVRPGFIETEIHARGGEPGRLERVRKFIPLGRPGKPEEIAEAIAWLLSDASSYCTGSFIDCAGGR